MLSYIYLFIFLYISFLFFVLFTLLYVNTKKYSWNCKARNCYLGGRCGTGAQLMSTVGFLFVSSCGCRRKYAGDGEPIASEITILDIQKNEMGTSFQCFRVLSSVYCPGHNFFPHTLHEVFLTWIIRIHLPNYLFLF